MGRRDQPNNRIRRIRYCSSASFHNSGYDRLGGGQTVGTSADPPFDLPQNSSTANSISGFAPAMIVRKWVSASGRILVMKKRAVLTLEP